MEERDRDLEQSEQKALLVLFFFSGVSSLVYQVVWARMLTVVFGTTLLATSTVLSAFMAGLALGSYGFWGGTSTAASTRCEFLPR